MEAATAATEVPAFPIGVGDANGTPLETGDRVKVTGSSRFGEGLGTVIGYMQGGDADYRLVDGALQQVSGHTEIRIRVRMDNGTDGDGYTASRGRVEKIDTENGSGEDAEGTEATTAAEPEQAPA